MFCNNCGNQIDDNAVVCPYCGTATDKMAEATGNTATSGGFAKTFCSNCGNQIDDNAVVCPYCGAATNKMADVTGNTPNPTGSKKINAYAIAGFVLSLVAWGFAFLSDYVFLVMSLCALSLSVTGLINSNKRGQNLKGLAIAGIAVAAVNIAMFILIYILLAVGVLVVQ